MIPHVTICEKRHLSNKEGLITYSSQRWPTPCRMTIKTGHTIIRLTLATISQSYTVIQCGSALRLVIGTIPVVDYGCMKIEKNVAVVFHREVDIYVNATEDKNDIEDIFQISIHYFGKFY